MQNRARILSLVSLVGACVLAAVACGGNVNTNGAGTGTPTHTPTHTPTPTGTSTGATPTPTGTGTPGACFSGNTWPLGDFGSEWMHPGTDCPTCHATNNGPEFWVAGTIYAVDHQPDDCGGANAVEVDVTEANGTVHQLTSNYWGNFFIKQADQATFAYPYTVSVVMNGVTRTMTASQTDASCNSCHTQTGANAAPGRVLTP